MDASSYFTSPFVVRLANVNDLEGFFALTTLTGPGFTSLTANEEKLYALLEANAKTSTGAPGSIILAMEDLKTGTIAGCAIVKRGKEKRRDFYNFNVTYNQAGKPTLLSTGKAYDDLSEIAGLFIHPDYRSMGIGKALAKSRYLYIATAPDTFGTRIFSELRGVIDKNGISPFYDAACKPWLKMPFAEADKICARGGNEELIKMLPQAPIAIDHFSLSAVDAIGNCHDSGIAARGMLQQEGFRFEGVVDLLDGGALVAANTADLTSLRLSQLAKINTSTNFTKSETYLFATNQADSFRCIAGHGVIMDNTIICSSDVTNALCIQDNDIVRVSNLKSQPKTHNTKQRSKEIA